MYGILLRRFENSYATLQNDCNYAKIMKITRGRSAMTQSEYLADPCGVSSLPYWKTEGIQVPEHMQIVHHRDFSDALLDT